MLILTRKSNESVIIGKDIEIRILSVHGDQISLGFSAPRSIPIYRKEVFEAIQSQNREAADMMSTVNIDNFSKSIGAVFGELARKTLS
jgi:carbon storage regulator